MRSSVMKNCCKDSIAVYIISVLGIITSVLFILQYFV